MKILSRLDSQPDAKLCIPIFGSHQVQLEKFNIAKPGTSQCAAQSSDSSSWMKKVVNWVLELLTSKCLRFAISLPYPGDMHMYTNNHINIPSRLLEYIESQVLSGKAWCHNLSFFLHHLSVVQVDTEVSISEMSSHWKSNWGGTC